MNKIKYILAALVLAITTPAYAAFTPVSQYTEDAAAAADPIGGQTICVRRDTPSPTEVSADGDNVASKCTKTGSQWVSPDYVTNPTGTITRPADTTAYAVGDLVANSTTAGSVALATFTTVAQGTRISSARLYSNHTTGLSGVVFTVDLWITAATFTNGDNGAYAVATSGNGANWAGTLTCSGFTQFADGAVAYCWSSTGFPIDVVPGTTMSYSLMTNTIFTPQSGKTFTLSPYQRNDR